MFVYEKKLQYPVKIQNTNPALAKFIISQYGGPHGSGYDAPSGPKARQRRRHRAAPLQYSLTLPLPR